MPGFGTMLQLARVRALLLHGPIGRFGRLFAAPRAGGPPPAGRPGWDVHIRSASAAPSVVGSAGTGGWGALAGPGTG